MGTSISYRSPDVPRWRVFQQALAAHADDRLPLDRLRAEFFLAAALEWKDALAAPGVAAYAGAVCDAWDSLAEQLRVAQTADTAEKAITQQVDAARTSAAAAGFTPAAAIAERAFLITLLRAVGGAGPVSETPAPVAADSFRQARGSAPNELVQAYAAELVSQLARHVAARDSVALVSPEGLGGRAARRMTGDLARSASDAASGLEVDATTADTVRATWRSTVERVFELGGNRPRS
jgi:hypothetical protein